MTDVEKYLKDNCLLLFGWNPFYKGILSDKERKMPILKYGYHFKFFCKHTDLLGEPVEITPIIDKPWNASTWEESLLKDLMMFMFDWRVYVWEHLNGYSGLDLVKFEFDPSLKININVDFSDVRVSESER